MKNGVEEAQVGLKSLAESVKGKVKDIVALLKAQLVEAVKELGDNLKRHPRESLTLLTRWWGPSQAAQPKAQGEGRSEVGTGVGRCDGTGGS